MIYGYARVSSVGQDLTIQKKALKGAGAEKIISEKASGKNTDRAGLNKLLNQLQAGDTLIITKMDRIARNVTQGIQLIDSLNDKGITLNVLNMGVFDNSPTSKLIRNILLSVGEWEREMILERQREGIAEAKARGVYKGMPKKYTKDNKNLQLALELMANRDTNGKSVNDIAEATKISRATIYREYRAQGARQYSN
ncbi:recombinase family protein [Trichococcus sp. K1Tr]|uniref:recombinase family protein n=1 Tax=Trichococcus sp. K1Tr TaxID=3020847 RepID=UPI00232DBCBE|nr:recombinase family protein [Trichococcus sp. K1Tr]MDB6354001.1 recombinase family protein [Trichococcus sp. K1Tr]